MTEVSATTEYWRDACKRAERERDQALDRLESTLTDCVLLTKTLARTLKIHDKALEALKREIKGENGGLSQAYADSCDGSQIGHKAEACGTCDGSGAVDSGGFSPDGQPIDMPCPECGKSEAKRDPVCHCGVVLSEHTQAHGCTFVEMVDPREAEEEAGAP